MYKDKKDKKLDVLIKKMDGKSFLFLSIMTYITNGLNRHVTVDKNCRQVYSIKDGSMFAFLDRIKA